MKIMVIRRTTYYITKQCRNDKVRVTCTLSSYTKKSREAGQIEFLLEDPGTHFSAEDDYKQLQFLEEFLKSLTKKELTLHE